MYYVLFILFLDSSCLLTVATGGDDNALNISTLQVVCRPSSPSHIEFKVIDTKTRPGAHVSSITGILINTIVF